MKRVHLIISGDIQGVGFRAWLKGKARACDVTGWVKNRDDGTVEAIGEGEEEQLKEFIELCHQGPDVSWVQRVDVEWLPYEDEFITFEVEY